MLELVIAFITGVVSPVIVLLLKSRLDKKNKPDMVEEALRVSELVTNKIHTPVINKIINGSLSKIQFLKIYHNLIKTLKPKRDKANIKSQNPHPPEMWSDEDKLKWETMKQDQKIMEWD